MATTPETVSRTLRSLGASLLALGRIRLELLAIEVQEEKERLAALLFWAVLSALAAGFGLVFVLLWVTVALWEEHRLLALGGASLLFIGLGAFGVLRLRRLTSQAGAPFAASLGELRGDEAALREPPGS